MRNLGARGATLGVRLALVAALSACGKQPPAAGAGSQGSATPAGSAGTAGSASAAPVHTAEGGAVAALPAVTECPKSLTGSERVARTIGKACGPVVVTGDYEVNGSLTLEAGAVLKFQDGVRLDIGRYDPAKLIVKGTAQEPVVMTSAGDSAPGAWQGVRLYDKADRSQIAYLVIENAGGDKGALNVEASDVVLNSSTIRNAKELGLVVAQHGRFSELAGNVFEKAGAVAVSLYAPAVADLGANTFDAGAYVQINGGTVEQNATWRNPGAPYVVVEDISIEGKTRATLEITAGTELRFKDAEISVGQYSDGVLVVSGSADKPVVFTTAEAKEPGAWKGISVRGHGELRMSYATLACGGAADHRGVLYIDGGKATVTATAFEGNRRGVDVRGHATLKSFDQNKLSASPEPALSIVADQVAALGTGNTFGKDARIEITGGAVTGSATWNPQGVPFEVTEDITVADKAVLTLLPGIELAFDTSSQIVVGDYSEGTLKAIGTAATPIKLRARRDDAPWKGLLLRSHTINTELAHVQLAHTGGDAGVIVQRDAVVKLTSIACAHCANAAVSSQCGAKLTTTEIKADTGTPKAEVKPDCK
jgi:hypothetical protein